DVVELVVVLDPRPVLVLSRLDALLDLLDRGVDVCHRLDSGVLCGLLQAPGGGVLDGWNIGCVDVRAGAVAPNGGGVLPVLLRVDLLRQAENVLLSHSCGPSRRAERNAERRTSCDQCRRRGRPGSSHPCGERAWS